ncbi:MAG: hypothetical protein ACI837_002173 [Crocinitomicaceae bacterium]
MFNLITLRNIHHWLGEFAVDKTVDCGDFTLSRQGISVKKSSGDQMILWQDLSYSVFELNYTFKSEYNDKATITLSNVRHKDTNTLVCLIGWLAEDEDRLRVLAG